MEDIHLEINFYFLILTKVKPKQENKFSIEEKQSENIIAQKQPVKKGIHEFQNVKE
jgi:hypothetical protein